VIYVFFQANCEGQATSITHFLLMYLCNLADNARMELPKHVTRKQTSERMEYTVLLTMHHGII
jgi:hypothetical protein